MSYTEMRKWFIDFFFDQYKVYWKEGKRQYVTYLPTSVGSAIDNLLGKLNRKVSKELE